MPSPEIKSVGEQARTLGIGRGHIGCLPALTPRRNNSALRCDLAGGGRQAPDAGILEAARTHLTDPFPDRASAVRSGSTADSGRADIASPRQSRTQEQFVCGWGVRAIEAIELYDRAGLIRSLPP
jgi:hypothetical protein